MRDVPSGYMSKTIILAYFKNLIDASYAPSTCWSISSMLKATIPLHYPDAPPLDWTEVDEYLKTKSRNWEAKKSKVFSREEVEAYLRMPNINISYKLIFAFGIFGGMRKGELLNLRPADVKIVNDQLEVCIRDGKTGNRWFMITRANDPALDVVALYLSYINQRPKDAPPERLFLRYDDKKGKFYKTPIGKNVIGLVPYKVAKLLNFPEQEAKLFTGHAFRRTGATLLADDGVDFLTLKRFGAWKSDSVAHGYIGDSKAAKKRISEKVQGISGDKKLKFIPVNPVIPAAAQPPTPLAAVSPTFNITGGQHTFYVLPAGSGIYACASSSTIFGPFPPQPNQNPTVPTPAPSPAMEPK